MKKGWIGLAAAALKVAVLAADEALAACVASLPTR